MKSNKIGVPGAWLDWWSNNAIYDECQLVVWWRGGLEISLGPLLCSVPIFRFSPRPDPAKLGLPMKGSARRFVRTLGKAFCRAGWLRPALSTETWRELIISRVHSEDRFEFILDTNALDQGVGHWLAALFADRCDLVVTAVTLQELQDQHKIAQFSKELKKLNDKEKAKVLEARQLYLASNRFRENTGHPRVRWRELEGDDTALLLARGSKGGEKSSGADTTMLREVRRNINQRVNGLSRFFVTGDAALARRAATELPTGAVINCDVYDLKNDRVYMPCEWWPNLDEGSVVHHGGVPRLIWELLAVSDRVELRVASGKIYRLSAFEREMWPSDWKNPWVRVEIVEANAPSSKNSDLSDNSASPISSLDSEAQQRKEAVLQERLYPRESIPKKVEPIDLNVRIFAHVLLDALATLALSDGYHPVEVPSKTRQRYHQNHLKWLLAHLQLAEISENYENMRPLANSQVLRTAWQINDVESIAMLLAPCRPFAEQAGLSGKLEERPDKTVSIVRSWIVKLGFAIYDGRDFQVGSSNPTLEKIRKAILDYFDETSLPGRSYPVSELMIAVFLRKLGITPVRAIRAWDRMIAAGVFQDIEFRAGGTSSGNLTQTAVFFSERGWEERKYDLETIRDQRDLVDRRRRHD